MKLDYKYFEKQFRSLLGAEGILAGENGGKVNSDL